MDLGLEPSPPPEHLYHGTARQTLPAIREAGLHPQSRQYVHLSSTREQATAVGQRHGLTVVLTIAAPALHEAGYTLYPSTETVWLTRHVPPTFIYFPEE